MGKVIPPGIIGEQHNRLTIIKNLPPTSGGVKQVQCKCECGNTTKTTLTKLRLGHTRSCGCLQKERVQQTGKNNLTHGMGYHPLHNSYTGMMRRCYNKDFKDYRFYGARGIKVCKGWRNSKEAFFKWALANGWAPGLELDRIKTLKGYSPGNCRFVTSLVNNNNRRDNIKVELEGEIISLSQACRKKGNVVSMQVAKGRIKTGWSLHNALTIPVGCKPKRFIFSR